jgi:two-component system phosphate regulon sensor histidine kinase PhoR
MSATLDRMLRFGALARGKLVAQKQRIALGPVVDDAVARFRGARADRAVDVEVEEGLEADADAGLLGLVLDNLLSNAAKYAPEGGPYRVVARRDDGHVEIAVADRGPGLDAAARARVFLPFERADDRLSRATEGTGVGLALVRGIARAHGGDASVRSEPGQGATFVVRFPSKRETA